MQEKSKERNWLIRVISQFLMKLNFQVAKSIFDAIKMLLNHVSFILQSTKVKTG